MALSRDQILAADDLPFVEVDIPEWGDSVFVKVMTAAQRDQFERKFTEDRYGNMRAYVAVRVVCDEQGKPLFTDADQIELGKKCGPALARIFDVAMRISGMSKEDVEDLEKNSEADPSEGSPSASRHLSE